ncbi:HD-GYP domain-containing protein [Motiliproteus sp. MSK22-1]|uniref:HD-GYP domain-containing protein n=1 Tax=Motiliproteus sp. MSK22-1 TaxID=1897630 RepID=UPI000975DA11|nr:HD domain-containing phosphohydrolase [Motiliproteus sp. MSK22-1]OMH28105.1 hypothetical protein BGP75_22325 [Motiliproteus sp. MSK22-1]
MGGGGSSRELDDDQKMLTVFEWVDAQHRFLNETHQKIIEGPYSTVVSRCLYLAHIIQKACAQNSVGILAALQLNRSTVHQRTKELFVAVLCELLAKELGMGSASRLYLICAAFTEDIAMLELQEHVLDRQPNPLTDSQKRQIKRHPHDGKLLIKRANINTELWLTAIEQHHEQPDGKGYPQGLSGEAIHQSARILRVADSYVALVRPRGDRPALTPKEALKEIFIHRGTRFDTIVARALVAILGMYPPGSWVLLYNGEIGVVSSMGSGHPFPTVSAILSVDGEHLPKALERDTRQENYTVIDVVRTPFHFNLTSLLNKIWPKMNAH